MVVSALIIRYDDDDDDDNNHDDDNDLSIWSWFPHWSYGYLMI